MSVAFIYDPIFLDHNTGSMHPECANRLRSIMEHIKPLENKLTWIEPEQATLDMIQMVHPAFHIQSVEEASRFESAIDADTQVSSSSYEAALTAVGA
ncbi:MAG: histone deacetylase, partial [Thiovulaceae bacterium]|nr:histone deacetylase [Sulfurimonadaceae bacterium]